MRRPAKVPGCTAQLWDKPPVLPGTVASTPAAAEQTPADMQQPLHSNLMSSEIHRINLSDSHMYPGENAHIDLNGGVTAQRTW